MMTDEGMPEILEMEMGEKYSDFGADTSASNGDSSGGDGAGTGGGGGSADKEDSSRRMLIRRGQLELQLERPPLRRQGQDPAAEEAQQKAEAETAAAIMNSARQAVIEIFEASGGYIETYSKQDGDNMHHHHHHHHHYHHASHGRKQGDRLEFTARVPSDRFDSVMASLRDLVLAPQQLVEGPAGSVLSESVSTEDVTGQYTDAEARVRALRSSEQQLHVLMERADAVADILAISRELSRVTGELEAQQSVAQRLSSLATMSTIHLSVLQPMASWEVPPPPLPKPQRPVWQQALEEVRDFWQEVGRWVVAGGVLGMGVVLPTGVMMLLVGWLAAAVLRRTGLGVATTESLPGS